MGFEVLGTLEFWYIYILYIVFVISIQLTMAAKARLPLKIFFHILNQELRL